MLCLLDPQDISGKVLYLPAPLYFIVSLFDGCHSILDIQAEYMRRFGEFLFTEKIEKIIGELDENLFLEGDRFREALKRKEEHFREAPVREPVFAGKSYEANAERLKAQLSGYFSGPEGPGLPSGERDGNGLKGVIAPHIDFQRGGACYAFAHRKIWGRGQPSCFIIFGTAHTLMAQPFSLTRKDFSTPLGILNVDQELVDSIQSRCPYDLFQEEGIHRSEHSIEFQSVFLRYLFPEPEPLWIVPILTGSFHEEVRSGRSPIETPPFRQFIEALEESIVFLGREACYIASADLAHMGLQFGDREGVDEYRLRVLEAEDREMLGHTEKTDGEEFFSSVARERDERRICGLPAIYAMLKAMKAREGKLLNYGQAFTPETQSVVSFASMAFY